MSLVPECQRHFLTSRREPRTEPAIALESKRKVVPGTTFSRESLTYWKAIELLAKVAIPLGGAGSNRHLRRHLRPPILTVGGRVFNGSLSRPA
jgi:hypothetical protein